MRLLRRRAVPAPTWGGDGAAARPRHGEVVRADWRAVVAHGTGAPPTPEPQSGRRLRDRPAAVTVVTVALGLTFLAQAVALLAPRAASGAETALPVAAPTAVTATGVPGAVRVAAAPARRAAPPLRLRIPRIGVRAPLVRLGLRRDGTLATPDDFDLPGWYRGGARPGEPGPAVLVGHVDSTTGPAVFFRLRELVAGDVVEVRRTDGTLVRYAVTDVRRYPKSKFPTDAVYGATARPTLRLVTCGGAFDERERSYRDNVVVFADLLVPAVVPAVNAS